MASRTSKTSRPLTPEECRGQDTRRGDCAKTITPELDAMADDQCRVKVPYPPRVSFIRKGNRIQRYNRLCTPAEISRFALRDDELRTDIERHILFKLNEAENSFDAYTQNYDDHINLAFDEALSTPAKHGTYKELVPPYYRWPFYEKLVLPRIRGYYAEFYRKLEDDNPYNDPDNDPYFYLPEEMAVSLLIWTGSKKKALEVIFNEQGVDIFDFLQDGKYGTSDKKLIADFQKLLGSKPSGSKVSKDLQKDNKINASGMKSLHDVYAAIAEPLGLAFRYPKGETKVNPVPRRKNFKGTLFTEEELRSGKGFRIVRMNPVN